MNSAMLGMAVWRELVCWAGSVFADSIDHHHGGWAGGCLIVLRCQHQFEGVFIGETRRGMDFTRLLLAGHFVFNKLPPDSSNVFGQLGFSSYPPSQPAASRTYNLENAHYRRSAVPKR